MNDLANTEEFRSLSEETQKTIALASERIWKMPPLSRITTPGEEEFYSFGSTPKLINSETGKLDLDRVDQMMATGQIAYPMALKKAPITTIVRSSSGFDVESADERLAKIMKENLQVVLNKRIEEILTFLEYGSYYGEVTYRPGWPQDYSLPRSVIPYWVIDDIHGCHPSTIDEILRDEKTRSFQGFVQIPPGKFRPDKVTVGTNRALVIPNGGMFGNLEGSSILNPIYTWWFWYELVWRAFLRYLQRQSTGIVIVKAPQSGRTQVGDRYIDNMQWALQMASSLHRTNYAAVPSDSDDNGKELWVIDVKRLDDDSGGQYMSAIAELMKNIRNFLLTGSPEDTETGEFEVMLDTERILAHVAMYFNEYVLPRYLMWNGSKTRVATLNFQGANSRILPLFFKLLAVAGNTAGGALRNVDWRGLMGKGGVPILTEEEVQELRDEQLEEQSMRFKSQWEGRFGGKEEEKAKGQPDGEGRWASQRDKEGKSEKMEMMAMLQEALKTPLIALTAPQVAMLEALGLRADPGPISLYNPWHDTVGKFTSRERSDPSGNVKENVESKEKEAEEFEKTARELIEKEFPAEKRVSKKGTYGDLVSDSQADGAMKAALPYLNIPALAESNVVAYGDYDSYSKDVCGIKERSPEVYSDCIAHYGENGGSIGTGRNGTVYLSPLGVAYVDGLGDLGRTILVHELFHTRKRSDGEYFNIDNAKSVNEIKSRIILEEGATDLIARKETGYNEKQPDVFLYGMHMGAIAIIAASITGFDRDAAWTIVDSLHFNLNNWDFVKELFARFMGTSVNDIDDSDIYMMIASLMEKAVANNYAALGWLFTGTYEGEKERYR